MQPDTQPSPVKRRSRKSLRKRLAELMIRVRMVQGEIVRQLLCTLLALFLPFVEWFSIPSPFGAAWLAALQPKGFARIYPAMGMVCSLLLRMLWGVPTDAWQYAGLALLLLLQAVVRPKRDRTAALLAGVCLLPRAVALLAAADWGAGLLACASMLLAVGSTLWFRRGLDALLQARHVQSTQDNACAIYLLAVSVAACGYVRFGSVNLGMSVGVACTVLLAVASGPLGGTLCGTLAATGLVLSGHSSLLLPCYALGGLACALGRGKGNAPLSCLLFAAGQWFGYYLTSAGTPPLPIASLLVGLALSLLLRPALLERTRALCLASFPAQGGTEDSFVQAQLTQWEGAMARLTKAFPSPGALTDANAPDQALRAALCAGCADGRACDAAKTQSILAECLQLASPDDDALSPYLQALRAGGCTRVHRVKEAVAHCRAQSRERAERFSRARYQREMTVTHLDAMAETLRRIRRLTRGETMADLQAGYQISKALRDARFPAQLGYARRIDGHLLAALDTEGYYSGKQLQKLLSSLSDEAQLPLYVRKHDKTSLTLEEIPLYTVSLGVAQVNALQGAGGEAVSGDSVCARAAGLGLYRLLLSDGMGHGADAHRQSAQTIALMLDCLEAGYSRGQAISAVNGMMLLASDEDRFSTVDLFELSLWSGEVCSEKLGACESFLVRGNHVKRIEGASLPLGILEEIVPTSQRVFMHSGDILVAITDGISDAFEQEELLEAAILRSLSVEPQRMADALLREAILHSNGSPADDMTVTALLLYDQRRSLQTE